MKLLRGLVTGPWRRQPSPGVMVVRGRDAYGEPIEERIPLPAIEPAWRLALGCVKYALWTHWRIRYELFRYGIARF